MNLPVSNYQQIPLILDYIVKLNPQSVLDIGPGFGLWGVLLRQYLEFYDGRYEYTFKRRIDCVEVFPNYITELHDYIYDNILIGNVMDKLDMICKYDLVLIIGTLEHFIKEEGRRLLGYLLTKNRIVMNKKVLISTPLVFQEQGPGFGNAYEEHKSHWTKSDFENLATIEFYKETEQSLICVIS